MAARRQLTTQGARSLCRLQRRVKMSEQDLVEHSIEVVARTIIGGLELPDWEDCPEIGEHDWERVIKACRKKLLQTAGEISSEQFKTAYKFLEERADKHEVY